jgi:glycosyltransferase involved in cell wall biosynthesis
MNPEMGGAEVFTHEVLKRWAALGHKITLLTSKFAGCKEEEISDGVRILRRGGKYSVYWKTRQLYKTSFRKGEQDFVLDEINTVPFFTPKFVDDGVKIVALIHQLAREYWFYETRFPVSYIGYHLLEDRWLKTYRDIPTVTVSESTKKDLLKLRYQKIFTVSEGLNFEPLEVLSRKNDRPVIVYAGRLKSAKRPNHAIEAFKIVRKTLANAELWIIGDGPLKDELKSRACEGVKFFESSSNEQRRELIRQSWVLVNPSVREGFGLNVIEANALGVPCVAYDVPGLRDSIIDRNTGLLACPGDIADLAGKTAAILKDQGLRASLSQHALDFSRTFSWDETARQFMEILESNGDSNGELA